MAASERVATMIQSSTPCKKGPDAYLLQRAFGQAGADEEEGCG